MVRLAEEAGPVDLSATQIGGDAERAIDFVRARGS